MTALQFDTAIGTIERTDGVNGIGTNHTAYTFEFWLKLTSGGGLFGTQSAFNGGGFGYYARAPVNEQHSYMSSGAALRAGNSAPGVWQHIACTWDGANRYIVEDGVQVGGPMALTTYHNGFRPFGLRFDSNLAAFKGVLSEVRFWNVYRDAATIAAAKDEAIDPATPGLLACWRCDEGEGTTVADVTGNGFNLRWTTAGAGVWVADKSPAAAGSGPYVKGAGGFAQSTLARRAGGVFADGSMQVRAGGAFQDI